MDLAAGPVVILVTAVLLAFLVVARKVFPDVGSTLLGVAIIALPWNAVKVHGLALGDALLLPAVAFIGLDILRNRAPLWLPSGLWLGGLLIALSGIWTFLVPTSPGYLTSRLNPMSAVQKYGTLSSSMPDTDLSNLLKFELALLLLPLLVVAATKTPQALYRLLDCFVLSAVISSAFALMDAAGVANISGSLLGYGGMGERASGLGSHPNQLATNVALALPLALIWFAGGRGRRLAAIAASTTLGLGMLATGSRGGVVGAGLGIMLVLWAVPSVRRGIALLTPVLSLIGAGVLLTFPRVLQFLYPSLRFAPGDATQSNMARVQALHQAIADFLHAPSHGIGFAVIHDAQVVPLGLLAAGGLLAFIGFLVYVVTVVDLGRTATQVVPARLARVLFASIVVLLALGLVGNAVVDLYLYIPIGLLAAAVQLYRKEKYLPQQLGRAQDYSKPLSH